MRRWWPRVRFGDDDGALDAVDVADNKPAQYGASSGRYLTDLANVLSAAGLTVVEYEGWPTRSRSSGGYGGGEPSCIVIHHTASSTTPANDASYIAEGSDIAPISNLLLDRAGVWWVLAAGACNHAGEGGPLGAVPADGMNTRSIGVEAANLGTGEPWPPEQQDAYVRGVAALVTAYGIGVENVTTHNEWTLAAGSPPRKIDPAGPSRWAPSGGTWPASAFRADVAAATTSSAPPPFPTANNTLTADDVEWIQNAVWDVLTLWNGLNG